MKNLVYWLKVIVIGVALGLTLQFVRAFTPPSGEAPNGNVGAPLNTGSQEQTKSGTLTAGGLTSKYDIWADHNIGAAGNIGASATMYASDFCMNPGGTCLSQLSGGGGSYTPPTGGETVPTPTYASCDCESRYSSGCWNSGDPTAPHGFSYTDLSNCSCGGTQYIYTCNNGTWTMTGASECNYWYNCSSPG